MTNNIITNIKIKVIQDALEKKLITEDELKKYVGKYIDEFGFDSFINYLSYLIATPTINNADCFLTLNQKMLIDKKELEARFKLRIVSPNQVWENMQDDLFKRI
jgi:hypothetical protein